MTPGLSKEQAEYEADRAIKEWREKRDALADFLHRVDGLTSLVAYRYSGTAPLPTDVVDDLKALSLEARTKVQEWA